MAQIDAYHRQIGTLVKSFQASSSMLLIHVHRKLRLFWLAQISSLLNIQDWQARYDNARTKDHEELMNRLDDLEVNHNKLLEILSTYISTSFKPGLTRYK